MRSLPLLRPGVLAISTVAVMVSPSIAFCQGTLIPPGAPAPAYKTLLQIEPRIALTNSGALTIAAAGSYYLTTNITVSSGDAITIAANDVALDLNGFTISSTQTPASSSTAIVVSGGRIGVSIANGFIVSGVTNNGATFGGNGFGNGIAWTTGNPPRNVRVSGVSVSGCLLNGIYLNYNNSTVVESCVVNVAGSYGIYADSVLDSTAFNCGIGGITASTAENCSGSSINGGGVLATTAHNSYGFTVGNGTGLSASAVENCYGASATGVGLNGTTVHNCYGASGSGVGLNAATANNCWAQTTGSSASLYATLAENCYGQNAGAGYGIHAGSANNCSGNSTNGIGLLTDGTASGCTGISFNATGLHARNANYCFGSSSNKDGLIADETASGCSGYAGGWDNVIKYAGLTAIVAENCRGASASGFGLRATNAHNCYGICGTPGSFSSEHTGIGLYAINAENCYGLGYGIASGYGIRAQNAINCYGESRTDSTGDADHGIFARVVANSTGVTPGNASTPVAGISSVVANNSYGTNGYGVGLIATSTAGFDGTATACIGFSANTNYSILTRSAIGCSTLGNGPVLGGAISGVKFLGTP